MENIIHRLFVRCFLELKGLDVLGRFWTIWHFLFDLSSALTLQGVELAHLFVPNRSLLAWQKILYFTFGQVIKN